MALSQNLIDQFVKIAKNDKSPTETTVDATYEKINGKEYVRIDGSEILTPVTSTVDCETGERVKVMIKNHTAIVTNNITSPAARSKSVEDLKDEVDEQGNTIKQLDNSIEQQNNSIIQIDNNIKQINNDLLQANNAINQQGNIITQLGNDINQQGNKIEQINNDIEQKGNQITQLGNTINQQQNTINQMGNTINQHNNVITQQGNVIEQHGNTIKQQGNTIEEYGTNIQTINSDIKIINSGFVIENGVLTGLSQIIIDTLTGHNAYIDFAQIGIADVSKLFATAGIIKDLVVDNQHIVGELVGVTIKGDLIEGNTVKADKLVVLGSDGLYYKLNVTAETVESEQTEQNSLNGKVIAAKSITASKVSVEDLVAFDATIGGFNISEHSIYSGSKADMTSTLPGIYLDDSGQVYFGNANDYLKFFRDENNQWKLDIAASTIKFGANGTTVEAAFNQVNQTIEDNENALKAVMRYEILDGYGTLTIGTVNEESPINYYTQIDNDEIRFISVTKDAQGNDVTNVISKMDNKSLEIDKVTARNELIIGNKFRWRNLVNDGMILEKIN